MHFLVLARQCFSTFFSSSITITNKTLGTENLNNTEFLLF